MFGSRIPMRSMALALAVFSCGAETTTINIQSGSAAFEVETNMPGVEVKGKSTALSAQVEVARDGGGLTLQHIKATLPVKSLVTGMKVRDEHMRKYIFTTPDGQEPDVVFATETISCTAHGNDFDCPMNGTLTIRGVTHSLTMRLHVKEQGASPISMRAAGRCNRQAQRLWHRPSIAIRSQALE